MKQLQTNPVHLEANKRFKQFRIAEFGDQKSAAEFLGIKQPKISKIELGKQSLSPEQRRKLVRERGMNPKWYDTGIGSMYLNKEDKKRNLVTDITEMQADIDQLRSEISAIRKIVVDLVSELRNK